MGVIPDDVHDECKRALAEVQAQLDLANSSEAAREHERTLNALADATNALAEAQAKLEEFDCGARNGEPCRSDLKRCLFCYAVQHSQRADRAEAKLAASEAAHEDFLRHDDADRREAKRLAEQAASQVRGLRDVGRDLLAYSWSPSGPEWANVKAVPEPTLERLRAALAGEGEPEREAPPTCARCGKQAVTGHHLGPLVLLGPEEPRTPMHAFCAAEHLHALVYPPAPPAPREPAALVPCSFCGEPTEATKLLGKDVWCGLCPANPAAPREPEGER